MERRSRQGVKQLWENGGKEVLGDCDDADSPDWESAADREEVAYLRKYETFSKFLNWILIFL